jgi:chromosome segregation ATPase
MEMLLDKVNQNIQEALKKFQDKKNKEYEKTKKQISEFIGGLNEYPSETGNTINRKINELRTKIDNIKEDMTNDKENLRKKNETEVQHTMEGHSSRLEQAKDRVSKLEDEMGIKGKTEEVLLKQLKTCERNMQQLTDSIKRPNLLNHGHRKRRRGASKRTSKYIQQNNNRKFPKSRENYVHSDTGSLWEAKKT